MEWDPEFLSWLRSPDTRQPLTPIEPAQLERLNQRILAGEIVDRDGEKFTEPLDAALRPEGEDVVYPVLHTIPELLATRAIALTADILDG